MSFVKSLFARIAILSTLFAAALPGYAQVTRAWQTVAASDATNPNSVLALPRLVEANPGGRGALVSFAPNTYRTVVVVAGIDGSLRKVTFTSGAAPVVSTPSVNGWDAATKPRAIVRTPNGRLIMAANRAPESNWSGHGTTVPTGVPTDPSSGDYAGCLYVSTDDGDTWQRMGGADIPNNGTLGLYSDSAPGSLGYALSVRGAGLDSYEIMEFSDSASATAFGTAISVTGGTYFGQKRLETGALPLGQLAHFGEPVTSGAGALLGWPLTYRYDYHQSHYWDDATSGWDGYNNHYGAETMPLDGAGARTSVDTNYNNAHGHGRNNGNLPLTNLTSFVVEGVRWTYSTGFAWRQPDAIADPSLFVWDSAGVDRRREKAVTTPDNSGLLIKYYDATRSGATWTVNTNGVYAYRGGISNFTGGAQSLPAQMSGASFGSYFPFPQEVSAAHSGMMAVVSGVANGAHPNIYVSETAQSGSFSSGTAMISTDFGRSDADRIMVANAHPLNWSSTGSEVAEWNGRLVALGQSQWASGTPSQTQLGVFAAPTQIVLTSLVDGTPKPDSSVSGCAITLQAAVTGEPRGKLYYWWQKRNADSSWPTTLNLAGATGTLTFDASGNAAVPDFSVSSQGSYRLVVCGEVNGMAYDHNGSNYGVPSTVVAVSMPASASFSNPKILDGSTQVGTQSYSACVSKSLTLSVTLANGDTNSIDWYVGATNVGNGPTLSIVTPGSSTVYEARYSGTACAPPAPVDFSINVLPSIGALTVSRTVTSISGSSLIPSGTPDTVAGCPGTAITFSGTAANAEFFALDRGAGVNAMAIGAGNTWTVARMAASLALNSNPGFEGGATGWDLPFGWNVQNMAPAGGTPEGNLAAVGINSPGSIVSHDLTIVDSSKNFFFFAAGKTVFQNGARNIRLFVDCYGVDRVTSIGSMAITNNLMTNAWHSYGGTVGPNGTPFLAGTAFVKLRVVMPDGECYLDAVRLIQLDASQFQMASLYAGQYGGSITSLWDDMLGYDTGVPITRTYRMVASQSNGCGSAIVSNLQAQTYPRTIFGGYSAVVGVTDYLIPNANPALPMNVSVCDQAGTVALSAIASDGGVSVQWFQANDSPNFTAWAPLSGANGSTYLYTVPVGGGHAHLKAVSAGSGCDFTQVESRIFDVVTAPSPTATLIASANVCSGGTVTFNAAIANGTATWGISTDGRLTWTPFIPTFIAGNVYQVAAPTLPGSSSLTVNYRLSVTSAGCSTVWATGGTNGVTTVVVPPVTLTSPILSAPGFTNTTTTSVTVCSGSTVNVGVSVPNGNVNSVEWWAGGTQVGTGNTLTFNPISTTIVEARYPANICGTPSPIDFTITVSPALGALSVGRTITTVSGGSLVHSAVVDPVNGCPGGATTFTATAANADTFTLDRGAGINSNAIGSGNTWTVPRLAATLALNSNPGFESGATGWDLPFGWNAQNVASVGGTPEGSQAVVGVNSPGPIVTHDPIIVDNTKNYFFFAAGKTTFQTGSRNIRLYVDCYGTDRTTPLGGVSISDNLLDNTWKSYGGLVGPLGVHFLTGTAYVKLRVVMPDGESYLDAVRLIPVDSTQYQMATVFAAQYSNSIPALWDDVVGYGTGNPVSQSYRMLANQTSGCGSAVLSNFQVQTYPRLVFYGYQAMVAGTDYLIPNSDPTLPMTTTVCDQAGSLSLVAIPTDGSVSIQWYTAVDSPNYTSWSLILSATGSTYFYTVPVGNSHVRFKVVAAASGCDFTTVQSRIFDVVGTASPTATLSAPANACSNNTFNLTATITGGTPTWEMSLDSRATWTPINPVYVPLSGNLYQVTAPAISGAVAQTVYYRMRVVSAGCSSAWANGSSTGVGVSIAPPVTTGIPQINGVNGTTATICPSDTVTLDSAIVAPTGTTYQWQKRANAAAAWANVPGATNVTLNVTAPSSITPSSEQYMIIVVPTCGSTFNTSGNPFTLSYNSAVNVSSQPVAPAVSCSGASQSLSFGASGAQAISWTESAFSSDDYLLSSLSGDTITVPALASGPALNPDPSFELGVDQNVLKRIDGAVGSSVGWDRTDVAYHGNASAKTVGGDITLLHPYSIVTIDPTRAYLVIAAIRATGAAGVPSTRAHSLGLRAYDNTGSPVGADIWLPGATGVVAGSSTYKPVGAFINGGGTSPAFPVGTTGIRLLVRLNAGGTTEDGFLDDFRIVPVDGNEMALLAARPSGVSMPEFWDGRAGRDASGTAQRTFTYMATAVSSCGSVSSHSVAVNAIPKPYIAQHPAAMTTLCSGAPITLNAVVIGGGTQTLTWQQSDDGGQTWTVIPGENNASYTYSSPVVLATTTMKFRLLIISTCGTFVTNVATVVVNPTPAILTDLGIQATACSDDLISVAFKAQGGNLLWETSLDGGAWTPIVPNVVSTGLWSVTLPTVTGNLAKTLQMRVTVNSGLGCATMVSRVQSLQLRPKAAILTQPVGFTSCLTGVSVPYMSVAADGSGNNFQWQVNDGSGWVNAPGATGYSFAPSIPNGRTTDYTVQVRVVVTAERNSVTSNTAVANFYAPPVITAQPQGSSIASGQMAVLFMTASGTANTYQWEQSPDGSAWNVIPGATNPGLNLANQTASGLNTSVTYYRVTVSGIGCNPVVSNAAKVTVYPTPAVVAVVGPSAHLCSGQYATLTGTLSAGNTLTYQWEAQTFGVWTAIPGAISSTYTESQTATGSTSVVRYFRVVVTDALGQTAASSSVQSTWDPQIVVTSNPNGSNIGSGQSAAMSVAATGTSLTYQWERSLDGSAWSQISGATAATLNTGALTATGLNTTVYYYRVAVSGASCNAVISSVAQVAVYPVPVAAPVSITANPACSGSTIRFSAGITAGYGLSIQWQTSVTGPWVDIPGATSTTYDALVAVPANSNVGQVYRVVVTDAVGQVVSSAGVAGVWTPATVIVSQTSQPGIACSGVTTVVGLQATGASNIQWVETASDGGPVLTYPAGANISAPVLASGPALNPDPSFEAGTSEVERVGGATGSSIKLDATNAAYFGSQSLQTAGGNIIIRTPFNGRVAVDMSRAYMLIGAVKGDAALLSRLGFEAFDSNGLSLGISYVVIGAPNATTWTSMGAVVNAGGSSVAFPGGTTSVKLLADLNRGGYSEVGGLDDFRIIPLSGNEAALVTTPAAGYTVGSWWDARAGRDASGQVTRVFSYTATVTGACGSITGQPVNLSAAAATVFASQPQDATICSAGSQTFDASVFGGGNLSYTWQSSTNQITWTAIAGANSPSYTFMAPTVTTPQVTYLRLQVIGVCGVLTSRVATVTVNPNAALTKDLTGPTLACSGDTLNLVVGATGAGAQIWEQQINGGGWTTISSVVAGTLPVPVTATGTASTTYNFRVTFSAAGGCSTTSSSILNVTVRPAVVIGTQPADFVTCPTFNTTGFTVVPSSGLNVTYQWQSNATGSWVPVVGGTGSTYVPQAPSGATFPLSMQYRVVLGGDCGSAISNPATVTFEAPAKITTQPSNTSLASGQSTTLSVTATGSNLTYSWEQSADGISWNLVSGATSATLGTGNLTATGVQITSYYYRATVSGSSCQPVVSSVVQVQVYPAPAAIAAADGSNVSCTATNVTVRAQVTSGVNLTYQWQTLVGAIWQPISGATGSSTVLIRTAYGSTPAQVQIRAIGADAIGQTYISAAETVTWNPLPIITTQPLSTTICQGTNVTLTAAFTGQAGTTGQWQFSPEGASWNDIPGATVGTLSQSALQATTYYRMRVSSPGCGDVYTAVSVVTVTPLVTVTGQPQGGSICSGDSMTLSVRALGAGLSYRWEKNTSGTWQSVQGNSDTVTVPLTNLGSADQIVGFRVTVTGDCGTPVVSGTANVTVKPGFQILTQPKGSSICNNQSSILAFTLNGLVSNIAWETSVDGGASWSGIPGATSTGYNTGSLTSGSYLYRAKIQGLCGSAIYTDAVTVDVAPVPVITSQPTDVTTCNGQGATFSVTTNVQATYQWYSSTTSNGTFAPLSGQTGNSVTLTNLANLTGAPITTYYRVVATPLTCGQPVTSNMVSLVLRPGTAVVNQPVNVDTCVNTAASVSVVVTGEAATTTWEAFNGVGWLPIAGATGTTVTVPTNVIGSYQVRAVVTGGCGIVTSNPATVKVSGPTQITTQPTSGAACEGNSVTMSVSATGAALTYRWEQSQDGGTIWTAVGASNPTLTVIASRTMQYRVTVIGGSGCNDSVTSQVVTMTVNRVPQDVPLETPTFASSGRQVYLQVSDSGPAYDLVTWTLGSQTATGRSVVLQVPSEPGNYVVTVVAKLGQCQSVTAWTLGAVSRGNGDVNQSGVIDGSDFARMQASFGTKAGERGFDAAMDLNGDGVIDSLDQNLLLTNFGSSASSTVAAFHAGEIGFGTENGGGVVIAALPPTSYSNSNNDETKRRRKAA